MDNSVASVLFKNVTASTHDTPLNILKLVQFVFYSVSGLSAVISSLIIIFTIIFNKCLHTKDFYLLAGLAGGDFIRGYGYLHGGLQRILFVLGKKETDMVTPYDCMMQIYQTFMLFGQQCSPLMVFNLALDRFLAVVLFDKYRSFRVRYALLIILISYCICLIVTSFAWVTALIMPPANLMPITCRTETVVPLAYFVFHVGTRCFPGIVSIFLYLATLFLLRSKSVGKVKISDSEKKRQVQLNKTVAMISINTIFFMTLPFGYTFFNYVTGSHSTVEFDTVSPFVWSLSLFGAAANLFIYSWKYKKFRLVLLKRCDLCSVRVQDEPARNYHSDNVELQSRRPSMI